MEKSVTFYVILQHPSLPKQNTGTGLNLQNLY